MLGSLVVHQFAYLLASPLFAGRLAALDHSHLSTQQLLVTPFAVAACAAFIVRKIRSLGLTADISASSVLLVLIVLFVGQEAAEFALQGHSPLDVLTHPPVPLGIVLAPLVVRVFLFTLRQAEVILGFLLAPRQVVVAASSRLVAVPWQRPVLQQRWRTAPTRGPPILDVHSLFAP